MNKEFSLKSKFLSYLMQIIENPLAIEVAHANECFIYDTEGNEYIDCISGIAVAAVGHNHPRILAAIQQQLHRHLHVMVYGEYIFESQVFMAEKLTSLLPTTLNKVYFTNSGAEAIEGAMKLAKCYTNRTKIIACYNSYHGSTQGALSITGNNAYQRPFRPLLPEIYFIQYNNIDDLKLIDDMTAAVFVEPIQSESGYKPADINFLQELRIRCDKHGALLVFDEAQSGFCRSGSMFAFEQYNVVPDILVLAKALGGGLPLGAFIANSDISDCFKKNSPLGHLTTFGGHPLSCAAGIEFINILIEENIKQNVLKNSQILIDGLSQIFGKNQISGLGLMLAVHFENIEICKKIIRNSIKKGILLDSFLFAPNAIRLAPPLTIKQHIVEKILEVLKDTYSKI